MGLELPLQPGQTALDEEEREGLLIRSISTQAELNEAEQLNIQEAVQWTLKRKQKGEDVFSEAFVRILHKRMFGDVWRWAGEFRKTNKNIGVDKFEIAVSLKQLLDDVRIWMLEKTYPPDEITVRFKHRMVSIHCFANGNGRHSRLIADIIINHIFQDPVFSWGGWDLGKKGEGRTQYLNALREADKQNISPLLIFARS